MPTNMFLELNEEKRAKIIEICITEFSIYGYENSSTNRIVRNANISKGSLFKYFKNKDELYFYVLDFVIQELMASLSHEIALLPKGLFERIIKYSELEFAWYVKHPQKCKMIVAAFTKTDTEIYQRVEARYGLEGQHIYYELLKDIDISNLKCEQKKAFDILKWFLNGFNQDFLSRIQIQDNTNINDIQQEYAKALTNYIEILKYGLIESEI